MNKILGSVITGIILYIASVFYPTYVYVESIPVLLLVVIIMAVIDAVFGWITIGFLSIAAATKSVLFTLLSVGMLIVLVFSLPIELSIMTNHVQGFSVIGGWTYFLLTVVHMFLTSTFSVKVNTEKSY